MASVKIPEQKIILCGEYGVGKSSLFRRYATNTFVTATDRKSTLGLDHYEKVYRTGDKEVKVFVGPELPAILWITEERMNADNCERQVI